MANKIQFKRGTKANMPALAVGEPGFATDTEELFVGTSSGTNKQIGGEGTQGPEGQRGSQWFTGTAMSGTSTSTNYSYTGASNVLVGDYYLNTSYGYVYRCTVAGSGTTAKWRYQGSIRGATGTGSRGPQGETGQRGSKWYTGIGLSGNSASTLYIDTTLDPTSDQHYVGDMYLNTETGDYYVCRGGGSTAYATWSYAGCIMGPAGTSGRGIQSIAKITNNTGSGESNTIRITLTDGTHSDFTVYNGSGGSDGSGEAPTGVVEYGLRWNGNITERVTRQSGVIKAGAETGLSFTVETDGSFTSSFDNIYPWSGITRETFSENLIMSKIPKYYICFETIDGWYYMWVCETAANENYRVAAIFLQSDGVTENDYYYMGSFESTPASAGQSRPGVPYNYVDNPDWSSLETYQKENKSFNIHEFKERVATLGAGWGITPISEVTDFWEVILPIEFGTRDLQSVATGVCCLDDIPTDQATIRLSGTDASVTREKYSTQFRTGMCESVRNRHGIAPVFQDTPLYQNIIDEFTALYPDLSSADIQAAAEGMRYKGQTGLNCGANPFVYRGIENPYGMISKYVDGLIAYYDETESAWKLYASNQKDVMLSEDLSRFTLLSLPFFPNASENGRYGGVVTELSEDLAVPYARLPIAVSSNDGDGYCDMTGAYYRSPYFELDSLLSNGVYADTGYRPWDRKLFASFGGAAACCYAYVNGGWDGTKNTYSVSANNNAFMAGVWALFIEHIWARDATIQIGARLSFVPETSAE